MRRLLVPALAALALAPAASAGSTGPCALVTASDAGKALGGKVGKGRAHRHGRTASCTYASGKRRLTVEVRQVGKAGFEQGAKRGAPPVFPVPGVGDEAYSAGGGSTLLVWQKGTELSFSFAGPNPPVQAQMDIAKAALGRL